jgi:hypothetical protein
MICLKNYGCNRSCGLSHRKIKPQFDNLSVAKMNLLDVAVAQIRQQVEADNPSMIVCFNSDDRVEKY